MRNFQTFQHFPTFSLTDFSIFKEPAPVYARHINAFSCSIENELRTNFSNSMYQCARRSTTDPLTTLPLPSLALFTAIGKLTRFDERTL